MGVALFVGGVAVYVAGLGLIFTGALMWLLANANGALSKRAKAFDQPTAKWLGLCLITTGVATNQLASLLFQHNGHVVKLAQVAVINVASLLAVVFLVKFLRARAAHIREAVSRSHP
jgi:uncharacterized iron-regulated membrane protein